MAPLSVVTVDLWGHMLRLKVESEWKWLQTLESSKPLHYVRKFFHSTKPHTVIKNSIRNVSGVKRLLCFYSLHAGVESMVISLTWAFSDLECLYFELRFAVIFTRI